MCKYWETFLSITRIIKNIIAADRDRNWELHVQSVEEFIPIFRAFDSINYLRYASWYLERIKRLELDSPFLYRKFLQGHFVVKDKPGRSNLVAPDVKLEQTI